MKRKYKRKHPFLYRHFSSFFWAKCCGCDEDFRRERGWHAIAGPYYGGMGRRYYLCKSCAPTRDVANEFFINHKFLKGRPSKPTAPPPMRDPVQKMR